MGEQTKNMLIGVFVIAACALIVWLTLFLKPSVGDGKETLYVRFANINRINVGTRVLFAGKPVGEVVAIDEIYNARQKPLIDVMGDVYYYQLVLKVDSHIKVYDTDDVIIQTSGLLGEKSIAIMPKAPPKGVVPKLITNQPIYAESADPIEQAFTELSDLATEMQTTFQQVNQWLRKNSDEMGYAVTSFANAMDEIKEAVQTVNDSEVILDIQSMVNEAKDTVVSIHNAIDELENAQVFANAGVMMNNLKSASSYINSITCDIASGTGTLGKLIKGDDLYLRVTAIMSKVNTMMNDINNYGILFHLNKTWQRLRSQQITTMNALDTPQSFKHYFETEVDDINTAMSRLSQLIDRAQYNPKKEEILSDDAFRRDFAELLRQAEALSSSLKLYNQQLLDAEGE